VLDLTAYGPDIVIEAAAPQVVRQYVIPLLDCGVDLLVMSAGALVGSASLSDLESALRRNNREVPIAPVPMTASLISFIATPLLPHRTKRFPALDEFHRCVDEILGLLAALLRAGLCYFP
jgi:hypothetical protein